MSARIEWKNFIVFGEIKAAAERRNVATAEFVRATCLAAARAPTDAGAEDDSP